MRCDVLVMLCCRSLLCAHGFVHGSSVSDGIVQQLQQLTAQVNNVQLENSLLKQELLSLKRHTTEQNAALQRDIEQLKDDKLAEDYFVGFTAYANHGDREYQDGATIEFQVAPTNYGLHYSTETSTFTCPRNAYYLFSASIGCAQNERMPSHIEINGQNIVDIGMTYAANYAVGSASVVSFCELGQTVRVTALTRGLLHSNEEERYSSFSGVLLKD